MAIKKGDFVELDFIGRIKETQQIFDLTDEKKAKEEHMHNPRASYGPKIICVGEHHIVQGIDTFLVGKEVKPYTVDVLPEQGFGKKDARLMKLIPATTFREQKIAPFPGLQITLNNMLGTVRTVSGGRIIVDFNHPLAGRNLVYELTLRRLVTDSQEKLSSYLSNIFQKAIPCTVQQGKATISFAIPEQVQKSLREHLLKVIPELKEITFASPKKEEKKEQQKEEKNLSP